MKEIVIRAQECPTAEALSKRVAEAEPYSVVKFVGEFTYNLDTDSKILIGKFGSRNLVELGVPFVTYDGADAVFEITENAANRNNTAFLFVQPMAEGTVIRNMRIKITGQASRGELIAVYNSAFGVTVKNSDIYMESAVSENLTAVCNNGNLDTTLETRADNFMLSGNRIHIKCIPEAPEGTHCCIGLNNVLANSVSVRGNYIFVRNRGTGDDQKAIGIYNSGRYMRVTDNNIKANGTHNKGRELEQATAIGFLNEGAYTLLIGNNLVAEWAGTAVALWSKAEHVKATGNKILATHTIKGRSIRIESPRAVISGNIITSTSRNARLIELYASDVILSDNYVQMVSAAQEMITGTGVFAVGCKDVIIADNIIKNTLNCGIYLENTQAQTTHNICAGCDGFGPYMAQATERDDRIRDILYRPVSSLYPDEQQQ